MSKLYNEAVFTGRFQPIHNLHEFIIRNGLALANHLTIGIGEPNKFRTYSNPFSYEERKYFIEKIFKNEIQNGQLTIIPMPDLKPNQNLNEWCSFMFDVIKDLRGNYPDLILYGSDKRDMKWFKNEDMTFLSEVIVSEGININGENVIIRGTQTREYIINDDYENFKKCINPALWENYDYIKKVLINL